QEATKEFLIESHENLDQLDTDLVGLEHSAAPAEALGRIFRTLHTIKGSCSFLGFPHLEAVAHAGGDLLGLLRDRKQALSPATTDALLRVVDAIRKRLATIESDGNDGDADDRALIDLLKGLASPTPVDRTVMAPPALAAAAAKAASADFELSEEVAAAA